MSTSLGDQKQIVDRGRVDQAAQRQDRLQTRDRARARRDREVDHEAVLERHTRQAQEVRRAGQERELVGVDG